MDVPTENNLYILIHSPLVGPLTWSLVCDRIRQRGGDALAPTLDDPGNPDEPFWQQPVRSIAAALAGVAHDQPLTLVAHSGAGPLLPAIRAALPQPLRAYIFVDAGIPRDGASRLDLMKWEDPEWAAQFQRELEAGGSFPNWSVEDLREIIPDETLRRQMAAELRPQPAAFFMEPLPVFPGWPEAPCVYIQLSPAYEKPAALARQAGWPVYSLEAGHFHMLVDAPGVADLLIRAVDRPAQAD